MTLQRFNQAPRPTLTLLVELPKGSGRVGEYDCVFCVANPKSALEHGPGHDNVFADRLRPASDCLQRRLVVERERPLSDERAMIHALHAFHGRDAVKIVPFLRSGYQGSARVAYK